MSWASIVDKESVGVDMDDECELVEGELWRNLHLWNQNWIHITAASRVKDCASCNWRFKSLPLSIK